MIPTKLRFKFISLNDYSGAQMSSTSDSANSFLPNLVSPLLGAKIVFATDEWFAAAGSHLSSSTVVNILFFYFKIVNCNYRYNYTLLDNMIQDTDPVWRENEYTPFGKWFVVTLLKLSHDPTRIINTINNVR